MRKPRPLSREQESILYHLARFGPRFAWEWDGRALRGLEQRGLIKRTERGRWELNRDTEKGDTYGTN